MTGTPLTAGLPASVRAEPGLGGLPRLVVDGAEASAEIYLQGAQVTSWVPKGAHPVLWMSGHSAYSEGVPLRGGVPLCFPWFGQHPDGGPMHGFARTTPWDLLDAAETGEDVVLTLGLTDSATTRASVWPHRFEARLTVTVGRRLTLALEVRNTDDRDFSFTEAFHTYLAVGDVRTVTVGGLEGSSYVDKLLSPGRREATGTPLTLDAETDRVYALAGPVTVDDPAGDRRVRVSASGAAESVVWNPWVTKSAAMADFGDDEWTGMLCVEAGSMLEPVGLGPGRSHTVTTTLEVTPRA
jgi:glucose-6-phosphate 1-epimerase